MGQPHDPTNPRHARIFELLRQSHQAQLTASRVSYAQKAQEQPPRVVWKIQQDAINSFKAPPKAERS